MHNNFMLNIFQIGFMAILLFIDSVFLGLNGEQLAVAVVGSISGSILLTYFRREKSVLERVFRILASSIAGLFAGAAANKYFNLESAEYAAFTYLLTAFLSLIFLRAVLSMTEKNANGIVTTIFRRVLKIDQHNEVVGETVTKTVTTEKPIKKDKNENETSISDS